MRLFLALASLALISAVVCSPAYEHKTHKGWQKHKAHHLGSDELADLRNDASEAEAFNRWKVMDKKINEHNERHRQGKETYSMSHNKFSHMTQAQRERYMGLVEPLTKSKRDVADYSTPYQPQAQSASQLPGSCDWSKVWTFPPKNQGRCGSCWTFSTCGVLESALLAATGQDNVDMSEQYLVSCCYNGCYGCGGGWPSKALSFVYQNGEISESDDPYQAADSACPYAAQGQDPVLGQYSVTIMQNMTYIYAMPASSSAGADATKLAYMDALNNVGTVSICLYAGSTFQAYNGGVYSWTADEMAQTANHAVLIVGYGTDNTGSAPVDYWIVRNSWSPSWGENGHIRINRDCTGDIYNYGVSALMDGSSRVQPATQ